jgi:hypothetical protein
MIHTDEISSISLRNVIKAGNAKTIFKHRYEGGQIDWGYVSNDGEIFAGYGADIFSEIEEMSDLEIIGAWDASEITNAEEDA